MATNGVHFMAIEKARERLAASEGEYISAVQQLDEAIKMGDLRESSEYDAAKAAVARIAKERDALQPVLSMPVIKANDNIPAIAEGSIVHIKIYSVTSEPVTPSTPQFEQEKQKPVVFEGVLMYGATLEIHELMADKALSASTPIGKFLLGKQPGDYSVAVPAGFANISVEKLSSNTKASELFCEV